jgi:hypothetical protein
MHAFVYKFVYELVHEFVRRIHACPRVQIT